MRLLFLFALLMTLSGAGEAWAEETCGTKTCYAPDKCLDPFQTGTNDCWRICRPEVPTTCGDYCCRTFSKPIKVSVCVANDVCETDPSDGDGEGEAESDESFKSCAGNSDLCSSLQSCIKLDDGRKLCAPLCKASTDCPSNCCADIATGQQACMPADITCPQDQDGDKSSSKGGCDTNPFCDAGSLNGSSGLLLLLCAIALQLVRRRFYKA